LRLEEEMSAVQLVHNHLQTYHKTGDASGLARFARDEGIPRRMRAVVWPILLQRHPYRTSQHTAPSTSSTAEVREIPTKRIRNEISRARRRGHRKTRITPPSSVSSSEDSSTSPETEATLDMAAHDAAVEKAVVQFLESRPDVEFSFGMVHVCLTLAQWLYSFAPIAPSPIIDDNEFLAMGGEKFYTGGGAEQSLCESFRWIMEIMLWRPANSEADKDFTTQRISDFLTIFRHVMPGLYNFFRKEDVGAYGDEWVFCWIQWWFARELGQDEKGRLWDFYLGWEDDADGSLFEWHNYVCLAVLRYCRDQLEELETSEIRTLLQQLPPIENVNYLLSEARRIKKEAEELDSREDEVTALAAQM